jgi:hypothetical protein
VTDAPRTQERMTERTTAPAADPATAPATAPPAAAPVPDQPVPRLPRGRGMRFSRPELLRIAGLALLLVFLVVAQRPCADAVSRFVTGFGDSGSAAGGGAGSDLRRYEPLRPGMTDAELKAAIERARARSRAGSGEGSGGDAPAPPPSAPAPPAR